MEPVPFLGDVDDEKHYAQLLEVSYVEAYTELRQILADAELVHYERTHRSPQSIDMHVAYESLGRLAHVMDATVQQSVERRRRLADITAGLADVVLDEEGAEE